MSAVHSLGTAINILVWYLPYIGLALRILPPSGEPRCGRSGRGRACLTGNSLPRFELSWGEHKAVDLRVDCRKKHAADAYKSNVERRWTAHSPKTRLAMQHFATFFVIAALIVAVFGLPSPVSAAADSY